jgi:predicted PurR-regulated permease PerM
VNREADLSNELPSRAPAESQERRALGWAALAAIGAVIWLVRPVGMGIFVGMLVGFAFEPLYRRAATRWRPQIAAVVTVVGSSAVVVLGVGGLVWLVVRDGVELGRAAVASLGAGGRAGAALASIGRLTSHIGITSEDLAARLRAASQDLLMRATALAEVVASTTASTALEALFCVMTMYFLFVQGEDIRIAAERALPLRPDYTRKLLHELREVGRQTLVGTVGSGLMQGLFSAVGYWISGLPRPVFFGAVTAIVSLVPGVGTMLVWVPAGVFLILTGHASGGILLLVWGVLVVTVLNDYVLRPLLLGRSEGLPTLAMFGALFGGVAAMGLKGLIVGPVVMSLAFAVLKLYAAEASQRRTPGAE